MPLNIQPAAKIMIVDDEPANIRVLEQLLDEWGYQQVRSTAHSREALSLYQEFQPHLVLLDLMMPELDGFSVMQQLRSSIEDQSRLSILVLTADITTETKRYALAAGAQDFLTKPFDVVELSLRLSNLLEINFLHNQLRHQNMMLEERVTERTLQLAKSEHETAICLGVAGEYRDDDTGRHTHRVGATAGVLARQYGLESGHAELILQAAPLHDVGKIGIPDSILLKPQKLSQEEFDAMKAHCRIGHGILSRHNTPLLQLASSIALVHHERWDGSGYPNGLKGDAIPIEGRIVAIADVFDALTHSRPYKEAWPVERAADEIRSQAGKQFDPAIVEVFSTHLDKLLAARQ